MEKKTNPNSNYRSLPLATASLAIFPVNCSIIIIIVLRIEKYLIGKLNVI